MARNRSVTGKTAAAPASSGGSASISGGYEAVAASQTAQVLGTTGAIGDYLARLIILPASTTPGAVTLLDNATTVFAYAGGSAATVEPITIELGIDSVSGAFKITTGTNVSVLAIGTFT